MTAPKKLHDLTTVGRLRPFPRQELDPIVAYRDLDSWARLRIENWEEAIELLRCCRARFYGLEEQVIAHFLKKIEEAGL